MKLAWATDIHLDHATEAARRRFCEAVGDALLEIARAHPACKILVLCGHTHGGGELQVLENLRVVTGPAEYGKPEIQRIIDVE